MKPQIKIVDSSRKVYDPEVIYPIKRKIIKGYRVQLIAGNGEILQTSEQLESYAAVKKHVLAIGKVFALTAAWELWSVVKITDATKAKIWKNPFK
jgi:uncharacterized protein YegP (UPF0339 family)